MGGGARTQALADATAGSFPGGQRGVIVPECWTCFARVHLSARVYVCVCVRERESGERERKIEHSEDGRGWRGTRQVSAP